MYVGRREREAGIESERRQTGLRAVLISELQKLLLGLKFFAVKRNVSRGCGYWFECCVLRGGFVGCGGRCSK